MSTRGLASNVIWSMLNHLLSRGSMMLAAILLARHFDTSHFAAYSYFQLTISMLATYVGMGLGTAAAKFCAEHAHRGAGNPELPHLGVLWIGSVLLALVGAGLVVLLPSDWFAAGLDLPKWLLAAGVLIMALQAVPVGAMTGLEEFRRAALIGTGTSAAMLTGTLVAIKLQSISAAMVALLVATAVQVVGLSAVVFKRIGSDILTVRIPISWRRIWMILDVSLPLAANGMIAAGGVWILGRVILAGPDGERALALYAIGMQWFALAMFVPGNMGSVFLPRLVARAVAKTDSRMFLRTATTATLLISMCVAVLGIVMGPVALGMYGERYAVGKWLIAAYMGAAVLAAPAITLGNAMLAHGGQWKRLGLMVIWAVVLIATAFVVRSSVVYGGAIVVALAYGTLTIAMLIAARFMRIV